MSPNLLPTHEEIKRWIVGTLKHAIHIEYYLQRLQIGRSDIQRPHDLVGQGNKLEWTAIRGFAMQYRTEPGIFDLYVKPALDFHRQQFHHVCWNEFNPSASTDSMRLGAVDAVCSLLEPRGYQGGCHSYKDIYDIAEKNPIHKVAWMQMMAQEMAKIEAPDLTGVSLTNVPRCGLDIEKHEIVLERLHESLVMLEHDQSIILS